jgi:hypothetical protein
VALLRRRLTAVGQLLWRWGRGRLLAETSLLAVKDEVLFGDTATERSTPSVQPSGSSAGSDVMEMIVARSVASRSVKGAVADALRQASEHSMSAQSKLRLRLRKRPEASSVVPGLVRWPRLSPARPLNACRWRSICSTRRTRSTSPRPSCSSSGSFPSAPTTSSS